MPKYFTAEVSLQKTFQIKVAASNEEEAKNKAIGKIKTHRNSFTEISSKIVCNTLTFEGETIFEVGQKIKHHVFGTGIIKDLKRSTNYRNEISELARVEFEDGITKDIGLGMIADKIQIIG